LIQGLKSSFKEANFPFHHLLHLRIFYRCDLIDQNLLLETFEQVLVGSSTCAMTFVDAIKIQDHALLAIQATAQDLDKLETELWLRRLI
jgi:histone deacetylase complex regulatory component SIN3